MSLTEEELREVIAAVKYYQLRHVSVSNPRHYEYEVILQKLQKLRINPE